MYKRVILDHIYLHDYDIWCVYICVVMYDFVCEYVYLWLCYIVCLWDHEKHLSNVSMCLYNRYIMNVNERMCLPFMKVVMCIWLY